MKRFVLYSLILPLLIATGGWRAFAADFPKDAHILPESFLNLYWVDKSLSVGIKQSILKPVYVTANLEFDQPNTDVLLRLGAAYVLPKELVFLRIKGEKVISFNLYFYGGGGWQFSRNEGYHYPYLLIGTNYLFLFAESVYPLTYEIEPEFRSGFSFKF
ncbi:MAG TPA: hypothetical protein DDW93_01535 [Firmicutes bacterium]|jgi:hypothetical protein|nr:hypothetical protein [Bacillota bacterium]HBK69178.1 hypothetical protein [Bacillota bacterium]HBT16421.1 hypothetical protein [Bacillota bacterium]